VIFTVPTVYDALWLGRLGGAEQAAAGLVMAVRITMISPLMALSLAGGAVVSRCLGAEQARDSNLAASQALVLMVLSSTCIGLIGLAFTRPLMALAGADATIMPHAIAYGRIVFLGLVAIELVPSLGYMLIGAGAPRLMLMMSATTAAALIVSEPFLVRARGLEGAAISYVGSHAAGAVLGLVLLASGRVPVRVSLRALRPSPAAMWRILRIALPAVPQRGAQNLAVSAVTRMVAGYGAPTLAAWVVVQRAYRFALIPGFALARSVPGLVGQSLGSSQPRRATKAVTLISRAALLTNLIVFGLSAWFAPTLMSLLSTDPQTVPIATQLMRLLALGFVARATALVFQSAQTGAGDTVSPMVINLVALWAIQIPVAVGLSRATELGADGIWAAVVLSWGIQAAMMAWRYHQGRWRTQRV
jgi:putative MATE family efflux protein